ncbi:alpha/beta fold hydrolase [Sulfitobacter donghicola]|uniref:Alpha/beta hydrolase n=1 Tax=Sulfitobacter donghicola DSW-25 = KCTC 12864 = JCM 14565 TaxID=1300350 RepID=A0A073IJK1_9RHOB|nr:alpha/beta hydrolase [Sulfitobacter donghicola]KEJ89944.1 alpha/beta hydrolase [Sulfitobacter donghicola DSW-25 = KCTC 12864 = JCM 14565]
MVDHWTETVSLNGEDFFIRHWGDRDAPKILMLHGFPEYSGAWNDLAPLLAERFHCIAPDQRGYGQSWRPSEPEAYKTALLVSDMVALIGEAPLIVLGHDWGASVAYALTVGRPDLVSKLIIMNGVHPAPFQRELAKGGAQTDASQYIHFLRGEGSEDVLAKDDFEKLTSLFSANMDMSWLSGDTLAAYKSAWRDAAGLRGMVNWYRASPLQIGGVGEAIEGLSFDPARLQVQCPHLLVWGTADTALRPETTEGLEDYAPDLTRVAIDGVDHWLHHQKPNEVAKAILDWL